MDFVEITNRALQFSDHDFHIADSFLNSFSYESTNGLFDATLAYFKGLGFERVSKNRYWVSKKGFVLASVHVGVKEFYLKETGNDMQQTDALFHELAHIYMHAYFGQSENCMWLGKIEQIAELTACGVMEHFGFDTTAACAAYVFSYRPYHTWLQDNRNILWTNVEESVTDLIGFMTHDLEQFFRDERGNA